MRNTTTSVLKNPGKLLKIADKRDRLLFAIQLYMGLRCNELVKLEWSDILDREEAVIWQSKTKKKRVVFIHPDLREIIKDCHEGQVGLIFTGRRGQSGDKPMTNAGVNMILRKYMKELGVTTTGNPSSHSLRKTFGDNYLSANGRDFDSLSALQAQYGHSSILITVRYVGIEKERQAQNISNIKY